ncbi:MAG: histidine kinase [Caldilineaceae bacterium]
MNQDSERHDTVLHETELHDTELYHAEIREVPFMGQQGVCTFFSRLPLPLLIIEVRNETVAIVGCNRQAEAVFGYTAAAFQKVAVGQIVVNGSVAALCELVGTGDLQRSNTAEIVCRRRDGSQFPAQVTVLPFDGDDQEHLIVAVEDCSTRAILRSETEAIEAERRRIAHEIHDGVVQDLAALRFDAALWHNLINTDPEAMHAKVDTARQILNQSILGLRRAIFSLRPVDLETIGFLPALRRFTTEFGDQNQIAVILEVVGAEENLPKSYELTLFRIVQEALHNVGKHAQATFVTIKLDLATIRSTIRLHIKDNGCGFTPLSAEQPTRRTHFGLQQMRERVEAERGTLTIRSEINVGTELFVELPYQREKK